MTIAYLPAIEKAILDAYKREDLDIVVKCCLDEDLDNIVRPAVRFPLQVHDLVEWAEDRRCIPKLLHCLAEDRPRVYELRELAEAFTDDKQSASQSVCTPTGPDSQIAPIQDGKWFRAPSLAWSVVAIAVVIGMTGYIYVQTLTPSAQLHAPTDPDMHLTRAATEMQAQQPLYYILHSQVGIYRDPVSNDYASFFMVPVGTAVFVCDHSGERYAVSQQNCNSGPWLGWISMAHIAEPTSSLPDFNMVSTPMPSSSYLLTTDLIVYATHNSETYSLATSVLPETKVFVCGRKHTRYLISHQACLLGHWLGWVDYEYISDPEPPLPASLIEP